MITDRQKEVLILLGKGKSNLEIAQMLIITSHTVKAHISAIYDTLHVNCRVQAIIVAIKLGIIELDDVYELSENIAV